LPAALALFVQRGFDQVTVEDIAAAAGVATKTVFNVFISKERLFLDVVESVVSTAEAWAATQAAEVERPEDLAEAMTQLAATLLSPRVLGLRQLLVSELARFPALAPDYYQRAPRRVLDSLAEALGRMRDAGLLALDDERLAAEQLAFLTFGASLDEAMLRPAATPADGSAVSRRIESGVRVFLAAYQPPGHRTPSSPG